MVEGGLALITESCEFDWLVGLGEWQLVYFPPPWMWIRNQNKYIVGGERIVLEKHSRLRWSCIVNGYWPECADLIIIE